MSAVHEPSTRHSRMTLDELTAARDDLLDRYGATVVDVSPDDTTQPRELRLAAMTLRHIDRMIAPLAERRAQLDTDDTGADPNELAARIRNRW